MKIVSTADFMSKSKIYSSIKSEDKTTKLLASSKRATALQRLGVEVKSSAMSGNASVNVRTSKSPVVFDSDWVNSIYHQLKNDNDLRGLERVYEQDGELYAVFSADTDLRKVINPMWRGIQAWNFTMLAFERIDEGENALVYVQRVGDTNNHAAPSMKPSGMKDSTNKVDSDETPPPEPTNPADPNPAQINSSAENKSKSKKDTIEWLETKLDIDKFRPRGITLKNVTKQAIGNTIRIEADVRQINSTSVDYDLVLTIPSITAMDDKGGFSADFRCVVGNSSEETTITTKNENVDNFHVAIKDIISATAKQELKNNKD